MQRIAALIVVSLALVSAQASKTSWKEINGTITDFAINPPTPSNTDYGLPWLYALWVPENAGNIEISLLNLNSSACSYLDLLVNTDTFPCNEAGEIDDDDNFCTQRWYSGYSGSSVTSKILINGDESSYFEYQVNTWLYLGVAPEGNYGGQTCRWTIVAQIDTICPTGSVSIEDPSNSDDSVCTPQVIRLNANNNFTHYAAGNLTDTTFADQYSVEVPQGAASIHVRIQSSIDVQFYGSSGTGASEDEYDCSVSTSGSDDNNYADYYCYVPEAGTFYMEISPYYSSEEGLYNYTFTATVQTCAAGLAGYNCSFNVTPISMYFNETYPVTLVSNSGYLSYTWAYYYIDIPVNYTQNGPTPVTISAVQSQTGSSSYLYATKNRVPEYSSTYYRDSSQYQSMSVGQVYTWTYNWYDYAVPSRNYIGVICTSGTCNFNISAVALQPTTTTTTTATTTTTGTASTSTGTTTTGTASTGTTTTGTASTGTTTTTTGTAATTTTTTTTSSNTGSLTTQFITTSSASVVAASFLAVLIAALL